MNHTSLLVVDIETVPDRTHHEGDAFAKLPFHQVVAIAFVEAAIERDEQVESFRLREVRSGGEVGYTERQLIEGFFQYFERLKPRLVTFNGRSFDLPVLRYRAMLHGVSAHKVADRE